MDDKNEIIALLESKRILINELSNLIYGSIEVSERNSNKYIYVHYREDGLSLSKYVGEYSDSLYNLILNNTIKAKELKKELRKINKRLIQLNYIDDELDDKIKNNIDLAKRELVSSIYKQAVLEGIATTFVDTENLLEGGIVNNLNANDVTKIINLKHAWEFILNPNVIVYNTNFELLCEINKLVEEGFYYQAGRVRNVPVRINGTDYEPPLPIEGEIKRELDDIVNKNTDIVSKAIELLLYVMKKQIFIDGNKRTAVIFANHYLIKNGKGILTIPDKDSNKFKDLLINYYEGKNKTEIKEFLKTKCYFKI